LAESSLSVHCSNINREGSAGFTKLHMDLAQILLVRSDRTDEFHKFRGLCGCDCIV